MVRSICAPIYTSTQGIIMSSVPISEGISHPAPEEPNGAGKFSVSEDWLAVIAGLALIALALTGLIPEGLIP